MWILDILVLYGYNDSNVNWVMLYISVVWLLFKRNVNRVMWYVSVIMLVNVIDLNDICNNIIVVFGYLVVMRIWY